MTSKAMDSGWFVPLPKTGALAPGYRPSVTVHAHQLITRIQRNPDDGEAVEALAAHYAASDDQPSLANLMADWAKHLARGGNTRGAAAACVRAADAVLVGTGDTERAARLLQRALGHRPDHERALRELHALLSQSGRPEEAVKWLTFVADALSGRPPSRYRARVCFQLARLLEQALSQPDAALERYAEALREDNGYEPARQALLRLQSPPRCSADALRERLQAARPGVVDSLLRFPPAAIVPASELAGDDAIEVSIGAATESNFYAGFSDDARRAGVFLATYRQLPLGSELQLLITLPGGETARAAGRVRFIHDGLLDDAPPGVGVQLTKMTAEARVLIERFTQQRTPMFYSD